MRRPLTILAACLILAGLGAPLGAPRPVAAQGGGVPMSATLFTNRVQWQAAPGTAVQAVVRDAQGVRARGQAQANASGVVNIQLQNARGGGGGGGGNNQYLRASDTISLTIQGSAPTVAVVPELAADIDPATDRVSGKAPAGASVALTVRYGPADTDTLTQSVTADAGGAFLLDLAGQRDLAPGAEGSASVTIAGGHVFSAQFAVLEANFAVGSRTVDGRATLGTQVQVSLTGADGQAKGSRTLTVYGSPDWNMAGGGGPGGGGNQLGIVAVGDTAKVTQSGGAIAAPRDLSIVVPPLQVDVDRFAGEVSGVGPANTSLIVQAVGPNGENETHRVRTDAAGAFSVKLTSTLAPGWRVFVTYDPGNGLRSRALFVLPQVRVRLYGSNVSGTGEPGRPVTVTLHAGDGSVKAQANANTGGSGNFSVNLGGGGGGGGVSIDPGDMVEVDFTAGDPLALPVPKITAKTDAAADLVSGEAPAGGSLRLTAGQGQNQVVLDIKADNAGLYRAEFAGKFDIVPPANGNLTYTESSGHQFLTGWAAVQLTMTLEGANVVGNGPAGRAVSVRLRTATGALAATADTRVSEGGGGGGPGGAAGLDWAVTLQDNTNTNVGVRTGDQLQVTVGDDVINYLVPKLNGVALIVDDAINGETEANAPVRLTVAPAAGSGGGPGGGGPPIQADVTADEQGLFSHSLAGTRDLVYNDVAQLRLAWQSHIVLRTIRTPGLRLDLNSGTLTGSIEPGVAVTVRLLTASGTERAKVELVTAENATFVAPFRDPGGEVIVPNAGDKVEVRAPTALQAQEIDMTVPELVVNANKESNEVSGRATPGGTLIVQVATTFFRPGPGGGGGPGGGATRPQIQPDGSWRANFPGQFDVIPGQQFNANYRLPVGHVAVRFVNVPIVNAQVGGGRVCGVAQERSVIASDLSGTGPTGHGEERSGNDGSFELRLVDRQGMEVASAPGQVVKTDVPGETINVTLPEISAQVDWTTGRITGKGPADTTLYVSAPVRGCLGNRDFGAGGGPGGFNFQMVRTNATGDFNAQVQLRDPGDGFEVAMFNAEGHRAYRHVFRTLGQIYVRTDQVGGRATPLASVAIQLQTAAGAERGRAVAVANSDGSFLSSVRDTGGQAVTIKAGDVVRLESGGEIVTVPVEDLTFDFEPVNGLVGVAPPNRALAVTFRLYSGRVLNIDLTSDSGGRFAYRTADIPPRGGWTFADVARIRVVLPTEAGHEIISDLVVQGVGPTPTPPPGTKDKMVYLPVAYKKR